MFKIHAAIASTDELVQDARTMNHNRLQKAPSAIPSGLALVLLDDIAAIGHAPERLLSSLRLPFSVADLRRNKVQLISNQQFIQIYRECVFILCNHASQECSQPPMNKEESDMLCYCVINCRSLKEVIERASRFAAMLGGRAGTISLDVAGSDAIFGMDTRRGPRSSSGLVIDLTGLSFFHRLFSWLIGETMPIFGYGVTYEERANHAALRRLFHRPILYAQAINHFRFPARFLDKVVVRNYPELTELLAVFPFDPMLEPSDDRGFAETIGQLIATRLQKGEAIPTLKQFASFFNLSSATLRRRLAGEGMNFSRLKEDCRLNAAIELLGRDARIKVGDLALSLGFSDPRAFRRAFRSWTGLSPDEYRNRQADAGRQPADATRPARSPNAATVSRR